MTDKMKLFQKLHWLSIIIGAGSILLPIFFWKHIPEEIPMHYNAAGVVDRWENKSSLILLFFVIALLMGMMSITVYVLKSNMMSKYTNSDEVTVMQIAYPMVILMNVVLQSIFAYLTFCSVTCRPLGKWFLPVAVVLTFLPLGVLVIASFRRQTESKAMKWRYQLQEKEEKDALSYRTAVDWWLGILLGASVLWPIYLLITTMLEEHKVHWVMVGTALFLFVLIVPLFFIKYVFYSDHLLVSMALYGQVRIKYADIVEVKKTNSPLSSAALSLRRIQIDYVENGIHRMVLISPAKRNEFIEKLNSFRGKY